MMLGLVSAIADTMNYEEMIDFVAESGLECVEVACWPAGKTERRYAGVTHINVDAVLEDDAYAEHILSYAAERNVKISSLAYYPNTMDSDLQKREAAIKHLRKLICASAKLGVNMVTTFIGRDQTKNVEENLELVREIWPPIVTLAEEQSVKIAIENCPMLFDSDQWPGGQNLMTTPDIWHKVFDILPSDYLGLNYDPSHFVWQMIDYIKPIYEFKDKIFHVHYKDIKVYPDRLQQVGIMGYPLDFMSPKLPGLGDVNWGKYVSALTDIGYAGYSCIEIEDKSFEGSIEDVKKSIQLSAKYLKNFVI
ncbi:MAG TPA: sugar phosphate isomerase/epimerase [Candidatus Mediterraneibacter vanvlietii]|nr:sugar phosphate isomerase/epimerase [Candidatus Mediterraneibacter vanvlietii]